MAMCIYSNFVIESDHYWQRHLLYSISNKYYMWYNAIKVRCIKLMKAIKSFDLIIYDDMYGD